MAEKKTKQVPADVIARVGGEDKLRRVELPLDDLGLETLEVVVAVPNRKILGQYLKYQNVNPNKAHEILVKNCVLTDLDQVLADDNLFMTAVGCIADLIPIREGIIKKY